MIDVINPMSFPGSHRLVRYARPTARRLAALKARALAYLGVQTIVLGGFAGDVCVQSTAHDAFLGDYRIVRDGTASEDLTRNRRALEWLATHLRVELHTAAGIDFRRLRARPASRE